MSWRGHSPNNTCGFKTLALLFVLALGVRGGWGWYRLAHMADTTVLEFPDEQQYWRMGESLGAGSGLTDEFGFRATRMPLYPAWLSLFSGLGHGIVVAKVFQWLIGAAVAPLMVCLGTRMFGRRVGLAAGLAAACDPFFIFFSSLLLTETLFLSTVILLGLAAWPLVSWAKSSPPESRHEPHTPSPDSHGQNESRPTTSTLRGGELSSPRLGQWFCLGLAGVLCVYVRESSLGLVGLLVVVALIHCRFTWRAMAGSLVAVGVLVAALVPWAARNQEVTGDWCWLTHRGGISLYDGVKPNADGGSRLGKVQQMPAVRGLDEVAWDRLFWDESKRLIAEDPGRVLSLAFVKLKRTWNPLPNVGTYQSPFVRLVAVAWNVPIFALALAGIVMVTKMPSAVGGMRTAVFLLLPAGYLSVLHCLFVGSVRYRLGAMPFLEILAAVGFVGMIERFRQR